MDIKDIDFKDEKTIMQLISKHESAFERKRLKEMYSRIRFMGCRMWLMEMAGMFDEKE